MALQNRAAMWGRTVVSNCYSDGGNITSAASQVKREQRWEHGGTDPLAFEGVCSDPRDPEVSQMLLASGIRRVVVGHKPSGDSPAVCSSVYTGVEIVSADTSFSDVRVPDCRGCAASSVTVSGEPESNCTELAGVLRDGRQHSCQMATLGGAQDGCGGDHKIGTEDEDGWWCKTLIPGEGPGEEVRYLMCKGQGRHVEYKDLAVEPHKDVETANL